MPSSFFSLKSPKRGLRRALAALAAAAVLAPAAAAAPPGNPDCSLAGAENFFAAGASPYAECLRLYRALDPAALSRCRDGFRESGDPRVALLLADMRRDGLFSAPDRNRWLLLVREAAAAGSPKAFHLLGLAALANYAETGVAGTGAQGLAFLEKAAACGLPESLNSLAALKTDARFRSLGIHDPAAGERELGELLDAGNPWTALDAARWLDKTAGRDAAAGKKPAPAAPARGAASFRERLAAERARDPSLPLRLREKAAAAGLVPAYLEAGLGLLATGNREDALAGLAYLGAWETCSPGKKPPAAAAAVPGIGPREREKARERGRALAERRGCVR